jgi:hypothetical protein
MRSKFCGLTTLLIMFLWAADGFAQSPSRSQSSPDSSTRSQPRTASLLARSDMQRPKPLPIVRPLRFQEIPVATDAPRFEEQPIRFNNTAEDWNNQVQKGQSQVFAPGSDETH